MGIYNTFQYSDGTVSGIPQVKYGSQSKLTYSADPFIATAISNTVTSSVINGATVNTVLPTVELSWVDPAGTVLGIRILRNQEGFSETEEDGVILLDVYPAAGQTATTTNQQLTDFGGAVPLIPGKYAYYTFWVLFPDLTWSLSSWAAIVIPKPHGVMSPEGVEITSSENKFMSLFPRVYTSGNGDAVGEVDTDTDFYKFFSGLSYTLDEVTTSADLLEKAFSGREINPNFVAVLAQQLGLPNLPGISLKTQKKLIRQAAFIYKHKGTLAATQAYVSALTGYPTTATVSPNLLLSVQDGSFYKTVGNWVAGTGVTLTADTATATVTSEKYSVNSVYSGKVVTTGTNQVITLGASSTKFTAVPVTAGTAYQLSWYTMANSTGATVTPQATWYDLSGSVLSSSTGTAVSVATSWGRTVQQFTSPSNAVFMSLQFSFSSAKTYNIDLIQLALLSDTRNTVYHEPRGLEIYLAPSKINYIKNSSFPDGTNWTIAGTTGTVSYPTPTTVPGILDGSHMLQVASANMSNFTLTANTDAVISGMYYTFSIYAKTTTGTAALAFVTSALDSTDNTVLVTSTFTPSGGVTASWARYTSTVYVPAYTGSLYLQVQVKGVGSSSSTPTLQFDAAQAEPGYTITDYFDGSFSTRGASWSGTVGASTSTMYPKKGTRINNLVTSLPEFIPVNTPYVISTGLTSGATIESSGFSS